MKDPDTMTVDELNDFIQAESNAIDARKEELRKVCRVRDAKARQHEVEKKLAAMDPATRAQILERVGAIKSGEAVGTPGK